MENKKISDERRKKIIEALVSKQIVDVTNAIKESPKEAVEFMIMLFSSSSTPARLRCTIPSALGYVTKEKIDISPAALAL